MQTDTTTDATDMPTTFIRCTDDDLPDWNDLPDQSELGDRIFALSRAMSYDDEFADLPDLIDVNGNVYDSVLDVDQTSHPIVDDYLDPIEPLRDPSSRLPDPLLSVLRVIRVSDQSVSDQSVSDKTVSQKIPSLQTIMADIEKTVNFNTAEEGLALACCPELLANRIQTAFDTFKEKTGRGMTYSEMRYMMG
jgi:hypothetical protein